MRSPSKSAKHASDVFAMLSPNKSEKLSDHSMKSPEKSGYVSSFSSNESPDKNIRFNRYDERDTPQYEMRRRPRK